MNELELEPVRVHEEERIILWWVLGVHRGWIQSSPRVPTASFGNRASTARPVRRFAVALGYAAQVIEHRYAIDIPHSRGRVWALMNDYPRWTEYAPMVLRVEIVHPGDEIGNGRVRRVIYRLPMGRQGCALELITDVAPGEGYTYTMLSQTPGNDQTGALRLESLAAGETRLHFEERYNLVAWPWRLFERRIYAFINRKNEESMQSMSEWLTAHPEYTGSDAGG